MSAYRDVQLWDSAKLPSKLFERLQRGEYSNGSICHWKVRGPNGPFDDPDYGPDNYHVNDLRLDKQIDDYLVANGAVPGDTIVWHIRW